MSFIEVTVLLPGGVDELLLDELEVCACNPSAAANSAVAPQATILLGFFIGLNFRFFVRLRPRALRIIAKPASET